MPRIQIDGQEIAESFTSIRFYWRPRQDANWGLTSPPFVTLLGALPSRPVLPAWSASRGKTAWYLRV